MLAGITAICAAIVTERNDRGLPICSLKNLLITGEIKTIPAVAVNERMHPASKTEYGLNKSITNAAMLIEVAESLSPYMTSAHKSIIPIIAARITDGSCS